MESFVTHVAAEKRLTVKGFLVLSRLPFLTPGLAALLTGIFMAVAWGFEPDLGLLGMSVTGLSFILLAAYYFNEYCDFEGDMINRTFTRFSGGSRAIPDHNVPRGVARLAGWASVATLVAIASVYMIWYFSSFPFLLLLALLGATCGIFYSHPPFQWAYRGIGELLIGGCYGTLAMVSGFYLISGTLSWEIAVISLPAAVSVFALIVANEFPDIEADRAVGKRNIIVRFGLERGARVYMVAIALTYPLMVATVLVGMSYWIALFGLPVLLLSTVALVTTLRRGYAEHEGQSRISAATLLSNALSSLLFIPVVMIW